MNHVLSLKCLICGKEYRPDEVDYVCPDHGNEGILDVQYDYDLIGQRISQGDLLHDTNYTMWRYKPLLPVEPDSPVPPLTVGWTPLMRANRLATELDLRRLWIKDDGRQPTASFKDRASAIAVVKAQEKGAQVITTASTGNAAAALSGLCASVRQPNVIFVPVSDKYATQFILVLNDILKIRQYKINTGHIFIGEHDSRVDQYHVLAILVDHHVLADFSCATKRNNS